MRILSIALIPVLCILAGCGKDPAPAPPHKPASPPVDPEAVKKEINDNEASAQACLKALCTGQEQFKNAICVDLKGMGLGGYGFLDELGGTAKCRSDESGKRDGEQFSSSPYIPTILGTVNAKGVSQKNGYCFICYLPTSRNSATPVAGEVDTRLAESRYLAYAWPVEKGRTGLRLSVLTPSGERYSLAESPCSGPDDPPRWDLALNKKGDWLSDIDEGGPGQTAGELKWLRE